METAVRFVALLVVCLALHEAHASEGEEGPKARTGAALQPHFRPPAPTAVHFGKQPLENFHDMFPPFGMSYQPLSQLSPDDPATQMGDRNHLQWGGHYPQQWGNPLPHNSPVDTTRLVKREDEFPGRAVAPFWWNEPPWWWKQGPWWMQKVKTRENGRPYGVLGDGPEAFAKKPELPSPLKEFHELTHPDQYFFEQEMPTESNKEALANRNAAQATTAKEKREDSQEREEAKGDTDQQDRNN